jgi:hypothetical protein
MMPPKTPLKFALMASGLTKAEAEALRKRYKRHGARYTQVKKSPYGGYDLRVGVRPLGPGGQGGLQIILTENVNYPRLKPGACKRLRGTKQ